MRTSCEETEVDHAEPQVDEWFASCDNPQKDVLLAMRTAILDSDERIEESIKWKSSTFSYKGNIASFNPRSKQHASLMFHTGASIPGEFPHLEGTGSVARYLKVDDLAPGAGTRAGARVHLPGVVCDEGRGRERSVAIRRDGKAGNTVEAPLCPL